MFTSNLITERDIPALAPDQARWAALEARLGDFSAQVSELCVDETDEAAATRTYVRALADAGLLGLVAPASFGGALDQVCCTAMCIVRQHLARASGALDTAFIMQGLGSHPIVLADARELGTRILPKVVDGSLVCGFALTEPEAGSDVSRMETRAEPDGAGVRLTGRKCFISNAGVADGYTVFAREAEDDPDGKPRYGAFWMPADSPGLSITPTRVLAPHPIGTLTLDAVPIPAAHRLGAPGDGLRLALGNLDVFRPTVGAAALGLADRAMREAISHLSRRVQFGKPLARQQGLRFRWAELATDHMAAQLLVYRCAAARDAGQGSSDRAAMAKLAATETAQRVVDAAVQALGGLGVTVGQRVEALYREVRALRIYEGTSEIQKLIIARAMF